VHPDELGKLKEFSGPIKTETQDLAACSIAPLPSTLLRAPERS
jgi:hypothetical protein